MYFQVTEQDVYLCVCGGVEWTQKTKPQKAKSGKGRNFHSEDIKKSVHGSSMFVRLLQGSARIASSSDDTQCEVCAHVAWKFQGSSCLRVLLGVPGTAAQRTWLSPLGQRLNSLTSVPSAAMPTLGWIFVLPLVCWDS